MKSQMLKFKTIALTLVMAFALFSCSDDGDDAQTFIQKNAGTVWTIELGELVMYAQINNSESNPLEIWLGEGEGEELCFIYQSFTDVGTDAEVLENSENIFKVRVDDSDTEYTILTLTISGNVMTIKYEFFEDGKLDESQSLPLQKTDKNPDTLPICELF